MVLHGFAHLPGFAGQWGLLRGDPAPGSLLGGRVHVGIGAARVIGVAWLLTAVAFALAGAGAATHRSWWVSAAAAVTVVSLALSAAFWPDARIGVGVNVVILVALAVSAWQGWL
jgi:hypothetical protein